MDNLKLSEKFLLISLNGTSTSESTPLRALRSRCLIAAQFLDSFLEGSLTEENQNYHLSGTNEPVFLHLLKNKTPKSCSLMEWMKLLEQIPSKTCAQIAEKEIARLVDSGVLDIVPSLLECTLNYRTSGIKIQQYRSSYHLYHTEIQYMKAEILENGPVSDEVICFLWLLRQSGDLKYFFSIEELNTIQEVINHLHRENVWAKDLFDTSIGSGKSRWLKTFLSIKKEFKKEESLFIETSEMFANSHQRILDIKHLLESNGHICEIKTEGNISFMEIDNVLYELVPDSIRVRVMNVHGVRLRRFLV